FEGLLVAAFAGQNQLLALLHLRGAAGDVLGVVLGSAWPCGPVAGLLGLGAAGRRQFLRLLQLLHGGLLLALQRPYQGAAQVALAVEQLRQVLCAQVVLGTGDDPSGLVAAEQQDGDIQTGDTLLDGCRPGVGIAAWGVLLNEQEVRGRLGSHQADVRAVEVLFRDQGDVPVRHALRQPRPLLGGEGAQVGLNGQGQPVQGSGGGAGGEEGTKRPNRVGRGKEESRRKPQAPPKWKSSNSASTSRCRKRSPAEARKKARTSGSQKASAAPSRRSQVPRVVRGMPWSRAYWRWEE